MARLGAFAALCWICYSVALGSSGEFYKLTRRFGVMLYFGCSFLAQVLLLNRLVDAERAERGVIAKPLTITLACITGLMFAMALYSIPLGQIIPDPDDRGINIIEWNFALLLCGWYLVPWLSWRK